MVRYLIKLLRVLERYQWKLDSRAAMARRAENYESIPFGLSRSDVYGATPREIAAKVTRRRLALNT